MVENDLGAAASVENASACYRDPRWPDPSFLSNNAEKKPSGPKVWNLERTPPKYREKIPKAGIFGISAEVFLSIWGYFLGSRLLRNNRTGGYRKLTFAHVRQA